MLKKSLTLTRVPDGAKRLDEEYGDVPLNPPSTPSLALSSRIQRSISGRAGANDDTTLPAPVSIVAEGQDILWRVQSHSGRRDSQPDPALINPTVVQRVASLGSPFAGQQVKRALSAKAEATRDSAAAMISSISAHKYSLPELERELGTNIQHGLTSSEAASRLERDGKNCITPPKRLPWIIRMGVHFVGGFQFLLVGAGILCIILYTAVDTTHDKSNLYLAIVLFVVVIVTGVFSASQETKSERLMEGFNALAARTAVVVRDGTVQTIPAEELVSGDVVLIESGNQCPADIRVVECNVLRVDNSSLTGEPEPLLRAVNCTNENPMETKNLAFSGTGIVDGKGRSVVFATGDRTVMGRIAQAAGNAEKPESTLRQEIRYFIIRMACLSMFLAIIFLIISKVRGNDWPTSLVFCIGVITANVPEGLLPQMTVQLTITAKQMSKRNVLVKNLEIIETLGSTTCIASDKTGTLTQNKMTVSHLYYDDQIWNTGINVVSGNEYQTLDSNSQGFKQLSDVATLGSKAYFIVEPGEKIDIDKTKVKGDASETALVKFLQPIHDIAEYRIQHPQAVEIPFNSNNKWALSINRMQNGSYTIFMKGAPERILMRCTSVNIRGQNIAIDDNWRTKIQKANTELARRGERVLGFACLPLDQYKYPANFRFDNENINFPLEGLQFCGLISLIDPPRIGVKESVATCQEAGIRVMMVTGDHPETARAIGKSIGIMPSATIQEIAESRGTSVDRIDKNTVDAVVVTGTQLMEFSEADWEYTLTRKEVIFARTMPQQKQEIVRRLQDRNEVVAVTGDGTNDSPALRQASCGVAMGIAGSDIAKEAAQIILLDDNFSSLVVGIEEGRLIFDNLKKCIYYTLTHLTPEIIPFLLYIIINIPLGLSTLMILTIDLGSELIAAVSLAWERGESAVMKKPPRNILTDRLVNRRVFFMSYAFYGVWETLVCFWAYYWVLINVYGFPFNELFNRGVGFDKPDVADFDDALMEKNTKWGSVSGQYSSFQDYRVTACKEAQSAVLFAIAISQLANIIMAKSRYTSIRHFKPNKIMHIGQVIAMCVMVLVIYCPGIQDFFFTHAVHGYIIALIIPTIPIMIAIDEARKYFIRRQNQCVVAFTDY